MEGRDRLRLQQTRQLMMMMMMECITKVACDDKIIEGSYDN